MQLQSILPRAKVTKLTCQGADHDDDAKDGRRASDNESHDDHQQLSAKRPAGVAVSR